MSPLRRRTTSGRPVLRAPNSRARRYPPWSTRMTRLPRLVFPAPGDPITIIPRFVVSPDRCQANGSQHTTSWVTRCRPTGTPTEITEEAFDTSLNPIRAKVSLGMRVLTVDDLGFDAKGGGLFMIYLQAKEQLARQRGGGTFAPLGITGIP